MIENFIRSLVNFSDEDIKKFLGKAVIREVKKKTILLKEGDVSQEVFFIMKGCIRLFYIKDGDEISECFFTEGILGGAHDSFISQTPSRNWLETIEDCTLLTLSYTNLQLLYSEIPQMNELVRKVMEERFVYLQQLFTSHILDTPEQRYEKLVRERPDLINRVPQHQLATFLGITKVSLSRIRTRTQAREKTKNLR